MDKLREAILELANSEPNVPLSATQNSILQQHLNNFLSCLHKAPDHPPYAWMIEKALKELDEKGGSSEDSISKFIKKEYNSLPWAHTTLLKHHLQKMTEKGEILMIDGGRFLLPGDSESLNLKGKRKRKYVRRKKRGNLEMKQKKLCQKEKEESDKQQNEVIVEAPQGFEFMVVEEDATANKAHNSVSVSFDSPKEDCVVHLSSEDQAPRADDLSDALKQSKESPKQQGVDTERLEEESIAECLLKTKKQQKNRPARTLTRRQRKGTVTLNAPIVPAFQNQQQEQQVQVATESSSEPKQPSIPRKMTRTQLKRITSQPALKTLEQENSPETKQQVGKPCSLSKKTGALPNEMIIPDTHGNLDTREARQLTELSKMEVSHKIVLTPVEPSSEKKQQPQLEEGRSTTLGKFNVEDKPEKKKKQQLEEGRSTTPGKLNVEDKPEKKKQQQQQMEEGKSTTLGKLNVENNPEKKQQQQLEERKSTTPGKLNVENKPEKKQQQLEEGKSTTPGKLNVGNKPDVLILQSPTGFEAVSNEKSSSQTDRAQRQLKRWRKSPDEPKSVSNSKMELLPFSASGDQHIVQTEEPLSTFKVAQHEVHLEQPKQQRRGRRAATLGNSTTLAVATNEEELCLDDPQDEVHLEQQKDERHGRLPEGKEDDENDPSNPMLKDLVFSKKLKKKQNGRRGPGRRGKAQ